MSDFSNKQDNVEVLEDEWMIRPCEVYLDEFKECSSWSGRLHEKFVSGCTDDGKCNQWKLDYESCVKYRKTQNSQYAEDVIESEKKRREKRFESIRNNNVWKYRNSPPADWTKPLPETMAKNTLPHVDMESAGKSCVIS